MVSTSLVWVGTLIGSNSLRGVVCMSKFRPLLVILVLVWGLDFSSEVRANPPGVVTVSPLPQTLTADINTSIAGV